MGGVARIPLTYGKSLYKLYIVGIYGNTINTMGIHGYTYVNGVPTRPCPLKVSHGETHPVMEQCPSLLPQGLSTWPCMAKTKTSEARGVKWEDLVKKKSWESKGRLPPQKIRPY